jgi:hypothetical protein
MCDLNPTELARTKIKRTVREHNVTADFHYRNYSRQVMVQYDRLSQEDWKGFCQHMEYLDK